MCIRDSIASVLLYTLNFLVDFLKLFLDLTLLFHEGDVVCLGFGLGD